MVMDYLRSLYYSSMRPYRDRPDVVVRGRWHWCPPGAKALPFAHIFGSFTLDPYWFDSDTPLGELPSKQGHVRAPENPRYLGQNFCGSMEVWQNGALYSQRGTPVVDDEGVPVCCVSGPPIPGGGECSGGALWPDPPTGGGLSLGGGAITPSSSTGGGLSLGGGAITPSSSTGGGLTLGSGVLTPSSSTGGGITLGGGRVFNSAGGGLTLGGGVSEDLDGLVGGGLTLGGGVSAGGDMVGGGLTLGGGVSAGEPGATGGGLTLGGGVSAGEERVGGGITLGGGVSASTEPTGGGLTLGGGHQSAGPAPGNSCATAGAVSLGQFVGQSSRPNGDDWFAIPATAGGAYHMDLTWPVGKGAVFVYEGTCAALNPIGVHSFPGCYDYPGLPAGTTIYVKCSITFFLGTDYDFTVDAGTC